MGRDFQLLNAVCRSRNLPRNLPSNLANNLPNNLRRKPASGVAALDDSFVGASPGFVRAPHVWCHEVSDG